jgi:hypothetical protein
MRASPARAAPYFSSWGAPDFFPKEKSALAYFFASVPPVN